MNDLLQSSSPAASTGRKKARQGSTETEQPAKLQKTVDALCKLSLSSAQGVRALKASIMDVYKLNASSAFIVNALKDIELFVTAARQARDQEAVQKEIGLPHLHVFNSFLKTAITVMKHI